MMHLEDKIRIKCFHCLVNLNMPKSKLGQKVKCPKCLKVFETDRKKSPDSLKRIIQAQKSVGTSSNKKKVVPKKSKKLKSLFLLILLSCVGIYVYKDLSLFGSKPDMTLLSPVLLTKANTYPGLNEKEINLILEAMKQPEVLLPNSVRLPEFSVEQSRPSRGLINQAVLEVKKILRESKNQLNGLWKKAENFELAFSFSRDPIYTETVLKSFALELDPNLDDFIAVADSLLTQKMAFKQINPDLYISFISKCSVHLSELVKEEMDPIAAAKSYYVAQLLPVDFNWEAIHSKIRPVLEDAFLHKNAKGTNGLFLTSDESTEFSLTLIKIAWQSHIDKRTLPEWLSLLAEKEACRLAFRLEPDGCLPDWSGENKRISRAQDIYKAAVAFDRDDLRYIAYCGREVIDAYRPTQKDFNFSEIGLEIMRTSWMIKNSTIANKNSLIYNAVQVTHDKSKKMVSLSVGSTTQMIFKADFKSNKSLKECFHIASVSEGFEVRIENADLELTGCSTFLLFNPEDYAEIKTYKYFWFPEPFKTLKPSFSVKVEIQKEKIIKLFFKKEPFI